MNFSLKNTDQDRVLSRLTIFYRSYCPLIKFSFPDFALQSFDILISNLVYELVSTSYRSSSRLVTPDLLLREIMPFAKIKFSRLSSAVF